VAPGGGEQPPHNRPPDEKPPEKKKKKKLEELSQNVARLSVNFPDFRNISLKSWSKELEFHVNHS
jgi:hypothetical protein